MHRNQPVLKDGPNTASRRRPLKRPHREPGETKVAVNKLCSYFGGVSNKPRIPQYLETSPLDSGGCSGIT